MTDFQRNVFCIAGLPFDAMSQAEAVARLRKAGLARERLFFSTPNLNFLVAAQTDAAFRDSVLKSDLSFADGMPVVWLARLLGLPVRERVAGASIFEALRNERGRPLRVCFFGGPPGAAVEASARLSAKPCGLTGAGGISPGYASIDEMSEESVIFAINACESDFIVVALGARKGQAWIERNRSRLSAPLISHLGAVVNFTAGWISRAPLWMQYSGLEWMWRVFAEPALWRRYWRDGLALLGMLCFRGVPLVLNEMFCKPEGKPSLHLERATGATHIRMQGGWTHEASAPLRQAFQETAAAGRPVTLDLREVTWLDSACIGLLMLLFGHQRSAGLEFKITGASDLAKKRLFQHCASYLLDSAE